MSARQCPPDNVRPTMSPDRVWPATIAKWGIDGRYVLRSAYRIFEGARV